MTDRGEVKERPAAPAAEPHAQDAPGADRGH